MTNDYRCSCLYMYTQCLNNSMSAVSAKTSILLRVMCNMSVKKLESGFFCKS